MADEGRSLGDLLDRFSEFHHMTAAGLAAFLGLPDGGLSDLRTHTVPEERDPEFGPAVAAIADRTGASAARIAQVARVTKILR